MVSNSIIFFKLGHTIGGRDMKVVQNVAMLELIAEIH